MLKKIGLAVLALAVTAGFAFAQVDVNKADQVALDGIKGLGPKTSKSILDERKNGDFKNWADLEIRVKGIGPKNGVKLSEAGLTVNGQTRPAEIVPTKSAASPKTGNGKDLATADSAAVRKAAPAK
jgi:competence protein ComEA